MFESVKVFFKCFWDVQIDFSVHSFDISLKMI